jgi:hypothetical protein
MCYTYHHNAHETEKERYLKLIVNLNWGHPVVYVKIDIGKTVEHQQKLVITCYTMQLVSTEQFGHHQAKNTNWKKNEPM